jgi:hypothetical protein
LVPLSIRPPGPGGCLPSYRPSPGAIVDISAADAGHFANPGRGAGGENDDVTPAVEVVGRPGDERGRELTERLPVGQRQRARIVEFILGTLVLALPANDPSGVSPDHAIPDGLLHNANQHREAVLDRRPAALLGDPAVNSTVNGPGSDHSNRDTTERGHDALAPSGQVRIEGLALQAAQRQK